MKRHRYSQAALPVPGAEPVAYSPSSTKPAKPERSTKPAKPEQGWLLFNDGSQLGPLFNTQEAEA
jgi:hypothetical protein